MVDKIKSFFVEIVLELKKVTWSTREEVIYSTVVVIVATFFFTLWIGVVDVLLTAAVNVLLKLFA